MNRDFALEQRIKKRTEYDISHGINSYGGMGMDGLDGHERQIRLQEIEYIRNHPEVYRRPPPNDPTMYMLLK